MAPAPRYRSPLGDSYHVLRPGIQPRSINANTNLTGTAAAAAASSASASILSSSPTPSPSLIPKDSTTSPQIHPIPHAKRYQTISIPSTYGGLNTGPAPGTVVGIVIGSVAGFIVLLYLLSLGINGNKDTGVVVDDVPDSGGRFSRRRRHGGRRPAVTEVIRTVKPRDRKRHHHARAHAGRRGHRDTALVDDSVTSPSIGRDVVEVIEENSSVDDGEHHRRRPRSRRARSRGSYSSVERY